MLRRRLSAQLRVNVLCVDRLLQSSQLPAQVTRPGEVMLEQRVLEPAVVGTGGSVILDDTGFPKQGERELLAKNVHADFSDEVQKARRAEPSLIGKIAGRLLEEHFPDSIHPGCYSYPLGSSCWPQ